MLWFCEQVMSKRGVMISLMLLSLIQYVFSFASGVPPSLGGMTCLLVQEAISSVFRRYR